MVETHHEHGHRDHEHEHGEHAHAHEPGGGHGGHDDWGKEDFVAGWIERQQEREPERHLQFARVRAVIPKGPQEEFRYLNVGAGPGNLDAVLLQHFQGATATLVDFSLPMLDAARERLQRFGDRVEYVQADLDSPEWAGGVGSGFDVIVSTLAIHHVEDLPRLHALYREIHDLLGHGGLFVDLDYIRPGDASLDPLAAWAAQDPEAGLITPSHGDHVLGTVLDQLTWLKGAGFDSVDVLWKDLGAALFYGVRDHIHIPHDDHDGGHAHTH